MGYRGPHFAKPTNTGDTAPPSKPKEWDPSAKPTATGDTVPPSVPKDLDPSSKLTETGADTPPTEPECRAPSAKSTTTGEIFPPSKPEKQDPPSSLPSGHLVQSAAHAAFAGSPSSASLRSTLGPIAVLSN